MKKFITLAMMTGATMWAQGQAQTKPPAGTQQKVDAAAAAKAELEKAMGAEKGAGAAKPEAAPPRVSLAAMPPDTVVATVDGEPVTAGTLQRLLHSIPGPAQQQALANPRDFITRFAATLKLAKEAEAEKLDQQSPYKEQLADMRLQVLSMAAVNRKMDSIQITPAEVQKVYDSNQDRFTQAKVKGIYIPFSTAPVSKPDSSGKKVLTEGEAKAKIEDLLKQARSGADFGKLAKENSGDPTSAAKDGDFGAIPKNAQGLPEAIKTAIFSAKAGEITEPIRQPNGFYIFRVEEIGKQPLDAVRQDIENELKQAQLQAWFNSLQANLNIKMEGQFSEPPSPAQSAKPAPAK
jgi:peptidyl-prolyl cis-trans isomerase C